MKHEVLDDEWYEVHLEKIGETFTVPGKLNTSLVEVYRNVWGEVGIPDAAFRCFGDYKSYVSVCQRRLDPKMGILGGVFKLEGGVMAAMPMLPVYDKLTACKCVDGMEF